MIAVLLLLSISRTAEAHPLHVSIVNITIDGLLVNIQVSTYIDDWETAYFHFFGDTIFMRSYKHINGEWFSSYLNDSFFLSTEKGGEKLEPVRDTAYFKDLNLTLEMHIKLNRKPNSLYIYNSILTDIFPDQTNLLIYSEGGREKGIRFDYHKKEEVLKLR